MVVGTSLAVLCCAACLVQVKDLAMQRILCHPGVIPRATKAFVWPDDTRRGHQLSTRP